MGSRASSILLALSRLAVRVAADFQNNFENITRGSDVLLQWDQINATDYPLVIQSRLFNQTSQYGANSLEVNITSELDTSSYLWTGVPYPLPYLETAKYEVEIWGSRSSAPMFASTYFTIAELGTNNNENNLAQSSNGTTPPPSKPTNQPSSTHGVNSNAAIAAGLVVPVVVILAVFGFVWTQRRQKRLIEERRKQREQLCID